MTEVYWLEQIEADVPRDDAWLHPAELLRLSELRFAKRRTDWRLGRWTAKRAVAACLGLRHDAPGLAAIEIRAAASGAPEVFLAEELALVSISLTHSSSRAGCAVARGAAAIGCDIEKIEPRAATFSTDYLTEEEQVLVARSGAADRDCLLTLLWSAKESALKALQEGLRLDTRSVVVGPLEFIRDLKDWQPIQVRHTEGQVFHGWCRSAESFVQTLVSLPPPNRPTPVQVSTRAQAER